jgi:transposase IS66 family protein
VPVPEKLDGLTPAALKALLLELLGRVRELERQLAARDAEIARLKGLKVRPDIRPSGMEPGDQAPAGPSSRPRRGGGNKTARRVIHEDRVVKATVPPGSRFKGYQSFVVQDLVLRAHVLRLRRERWLTPEGQCITAPLPAGVVGHFGPELRRFVLAQYHQGQVTVARLVAQLHAIGIDISQRQMVRLLIAGQDGFVEEARDVLRAGLQSAPWISADDTGARHAGANGVCTQIGNQHFAGFGTTANKSRLNFLGLLRAGHTDYVINDAALTYMHDRGLTGPLIARLANDAVRHVVDAAAWTAHLDRLGIHGLEGSLGPARVATEGALWGSIAAHGFLRDAVILSDDAGQFDVGTHALCWVHAERLVHRLDTFTDDQHDAQQHLRGLIWWFYADLKAYRQEPSARRRAELRTRFDRIFRRCTGFVMLDRLLARLHDRKPELLRVLDRPEIPLHTNGSENDIRCQVTKRKISGGTQSTAGRDCRDAFLGLAKTCTKLGLSFWDYLGNRLGLPGSAVIPLLPELVRQRASA